MPTLPNPSAESAILVKPIKDVEGKVVGLGELVAGNIAIVPGPLQFQDATQQTTAYVPGEGNVISFKGREGAVEPAIGDYTAAQVSLDPGTIPGVEGNTVQIGFEELGAAVVALQSGLEFKGLIGFNDADPATPPATGATHYYIFKNEGERTVGQAKGTVKVGDWLAYSRATSSWVLLQYSARTQDASGTAYNQGANLYVRGLSVQTALDAIDPILVNMGAAIDVMQNADNVSTFNGRTGDVLPAAEDYDAVMIKAYSVGPITKSTQVQGALNELERAIVELQNNSSSADALNDHINAVEGAHVATAISVVKNINNDATNVQEALDNLAFKAIPFFDTNGVAKPIQLV